MKSSSVKELLSTAPTLQEVIVNGWVKTFRSNRFIALNDGSTINNIQCVVDFENLEEEVLKQINTGAALKISGTLVESQGRGQTVEIQVKEIYVHGGADPDIYPIQPKKPRKGAFTYKNEYFCRCYARSFGIVICHTPVF
jgi:asparaginyl-tRNA synthetase